MDQLLGYFNKLKRFYELDSYFNLNLKDGDSDGVDFEKFSDDVLSIVEEEKLLAEHKIKQLTKAGKAKEKKSNYLVTLMQIEFLSIPKIVESFF